MFFFLCVCVCVCVLIGYFIYGLWQANFTTDYLWTVYTMAKAASGDSAHDLLSLCMCGHSSCPNWQWTVTNPVAICCLLRLAPWCWSIFLALKHVLLDWTFGNGGFMGLYIQSVLLVYHYTRGNFFCPTSYKPTMPRHVINTAICKHSTLVFCHGIPCKCQDPAVSFWHCIQL